MNRRHSVSAVTETTVTAAVTPTAPRPGGGCSTRKPTFLVGAAILLFWVVCAIAGSSIALVQPARPEPAGRQHRAVGGALVRHRPTRPRRARRGCIIGSRDILVITPLATVLGTVCGTALGLAMGYLGGALDLVASRIVEAVLALPSVMVAFLFIVALGPRK